MSDNFLIEKGVKIKIEGKHLNNQNNIWAN